MASIAGSQYQSVADMDDELLLILDSLILRYVLFQAVSLWTDSLSLHRQGVGSRGGRRLLIGDGTERGDLGRHGDASGLEGLGGVAPTVGA
jgi:hypothetical protein